MHVFTLIQLRRRYWWDLGIGAQKYTFGSIIKAAGLVLVHRIILSLLGPPQTAVPDGSAATPPRGTAPSADRRVLDSAASDSLPTVRRPAVFGYPADRAPPPTGRLWLPC